MFKIEQFFFFHIDSLCEVLKPREDAMKLATTQSDSMSYQQPAIRELTPEETKIILGNLVSAGDLEAWKILELWLSAFPTSKC